MTTEAGFFDALADCLESGDTLFEALEKVAMAGGAADDWARRVRRAVRAEVPVAAALRESNLLDDDELSLLSDEGAPATVVSALRAVAVRRRRSLARRRAIRRSLIAPFAFAVLTVVLDPLPGLVTGGAYVEPVLRGLFVLVILTLAIVAGLPALLRNRGARHSALRLCAAAPCVRRLAALYAEEELTSALGPFVERAEVNAAGLTAATSLLAWSPLREALHLAVRTGRLPSRGLPMGGLEPLARRLSLDTGLAIVGGVATKRLAERLAERGEAITALLDARLRLAVRIGAWGLVVLLSVHSLAGMISRGLPGMPTLPGDWTNPDQKQLEELMKQLEQ